MPICDACGTKTLNGAVRDGELWYCSRECYEKRTPRLTLEIPLAFAEEKARVVCEGDCPVCGGRGPVDLHCAHAIWSFAVFAHHDTKSVVCCQACGNRERVKAILKSSLFGWWGWHGVIMTPIQIARNLHGLFSNGNTSQPSQALVKQVREDLAKQLEEEDRLQGREG